MDLSKKEILEYLDELFIKRVMDRTEKGEEAMKKYIQGMIDTFKKQVGLDENNAIVIHYILSLLFSAMTEIETLKEIIKKLVQNEK